MKLEDHSNNNIIDNNTINSSEKDGIDIWWDCDGNIFTNNTIWGNDESGIQLWDNSHNNIITNNNIYSNKEDGITAVTNNNHISSNTITGNDEYGISIGGTNNIVSVNTITSNKQHGIYLGGSNNTISDNTVSKNKWRGIHLYEVRNHNISRNTISKNDLGIGIQASENINIESNVFNDNGLYLFGSYNNFVVNNTVNGKPLVYQENKRDVIIDIDAGQIVLIKCDNITVKNQNISKTSVGIFLELTNNCSISDNNISNSEFGIEFCTSDKNKITNNTLSNNRYGIKYYASRDNTIKNNNITLNKYGIALQNNNYNNTIVNNLLIKNTCGLHIRIYYSNNNIIFHNNFINNGEHAYDDCNNTWDDGYPSGGNYWSDYTGIDNDGDGIGDTPYPIPGGENEDRYPLMYPTCNVPPDKPIIDGPISGKLNTEYEFSFNATDLNDDAVMYIIDWGDDNTEWTEYDDSGAEVTLKHTWSSQGTFTIKAQAKDIHGAESDWATFDVKIERKSREVQQMLFYRLLEQFPILQKILDFIL